MDLLTDSIPNLIIEVNGHFYFDTEELSDEDFEYEGIITEYPFNKDYRSIINIMKMYERATLSVEDKTETMLKMFYNKKIPYKFKMQATIKALEFMDCGKDVTEDKPKRSKKDFGRLYSWEQDGNYIYSAINTSHNDILIKEPDLHWWIFLNKFIELDNDCQFNHIVANRYAHKKGNATDEQKIARREYPDIYILKEDMILLDEQKAEIEEMTRMLNS